MGIKSVEDLSTAELEEDRYITELAFTTVERELSTMMDRFIDEWHIGKAKSRLYEMKLFQIERELLRRSK